MSKIDKYNKIKEDFLRCERIIVESQKPGNGVSVHYTELSEEIYHIVAFSFSVKSGGYHRYVGNELLKESIGEACKEMKYDIINKALEIQKNKLKDAAKDAAKEARDVLAELEL